MPKRKSTVAEAPAPAEAAPPAAAQPEAAPLAVTRTIDLPPEDRAIASWRPRQMRPRPQPKPFDFDACRDRLKHMEKSKYGWINWALVGIDPILAPEEAHYWFLALTANYENLGPRDVAGRIEPKDATGRLTAEEAVKRYKNLKRVSPSVLVRPLFNLFGPVELVELLHRPEVLGQHWEAGPEALTQFAAHVLPYLSADEVEAIKAGLRSRLDPANWPASYGERPAVAYFLAALVGMPDELLSLTRSLRDDYYAGHGTWYHLTERVVFGLGTPQLVESEARRLKIPMDQPSYVRGWLATTGLAALDYLRDQILKEDRKHECEQLVREFARVRAPEAAPHMMELKLTAKSGGAARKWFEENAGSAIVGLLPAVAGRGKITEGAIEYLREAKRKGHEAFIRAALADVPPEVAEAVRKHVLDVVEKVYPELDAAAAPAELKAAFDAAAKEKPAKLPGWADPGALPPILVSERRLGEEQTKLVLEALQRSTLESPAELVKAVRRHAEPHALDAFAWKLFQHWQGEGNPPKEKWAMSAVGLIGGDGCALKITPLIRNWPGESQHKRATFGLDCLRAIGSDTALMQLNGIAQKLKFKALKMRAAEAMEAIAKEKGLTRAELEDRVVPDCDLDERGQRAFDFGPRQFRFALGPDMKPMVRDADGKLKTDLPKPGAKDDATKANEAAAAWKLMKKQIKEVAKLQAQRLEQAMVTGRRWPVADFESLLVKHPLMIHLVRLVLWGGYGQSGKLVATFRVTEDRTFADPKDNAYEPKGVATVGVVHPLHLSGEQKAAWGEVFSDYEIVPPFAQLGRPAFRLEPGEEGAEELTRFSGVSLPAPTLVFGLENRGWVRGGGGDGGSFREHYKSFPGSGVAAVVEYDGAVGFGYISPDEKITIEKCYFLRGGTYSYRAGRVPLGEVDPVAASEVIAELGALAAKAT